MEGKLGFDAVAYSRNRYLWEMLHDPFLFHKERKGTDLRDIADVMEKYLSVEIDNIPQMKANIIFQYKRPEFITSRLGKEWHHWNEPYYRYEIEQEQQDLLFQIHQNFNSKVLVVYASPAVHDINELVRVRKNIIKHTNFTKAINLQGHHKNTYIQAGNHSIACSDPAKIKNMDLLKELKKLSSDHEIINEKSNFNFLVEFSSKIRSTIEQYEYLSIPFEEMNENAYKVKNYKLYSSLLTMSNFRLITGNQWMIKL